MLKIEAYFALSDDCVQLVFSQLLFISGMEDGGVDITVTRNPASRASQCARA